MFELKKVSKFYYNKGVITAGFRKIDLKLNIGELVVITGESGSGKSTLANILSGLDSYEEGEMLVNGQKTSHYTRNEFEAYRKKYISNIYQDFNLVNSYSVYQNIELVLILNGYSAKEVKEKVLSTIRTVGLSKYKNTKVSKLSGGQKQRVAIARALVKDSPIIVADEPTGNIDSKSASKIMEMLYELSKERLVVVITHNAEQIEKYATRRIKMHDGRIIEDTVVKELEEKQTKYASRNKDIKFINKFRLGFRNTFNIVPKFLLLLTIFLFVVAACTLEYTSYKTAIIAKENRFVNNFFENNDPNNIIVQNKDYKAFTSSQLEEIRKIENIERAAIYDYLHNEYIFCVLEGEIGMMGNYRKLEDKNMKLTAGRLPKKSDEVVVELCIDSPALIEKDPAKYIGQTVYVEQESRFKIVGIISHREEEDFDINQYNKIYVYLEDQKYLDLELKYVSKESKTKVIHNDNIIADYIVISDIVPKGSTYIYLPEIYNLEEKQEYLTINVEDLYYKDSIKLKLNNIKLEKEDKKGNKLYNTVYVNKEDFEKLYNKGVFQVDATVKNIDELDTTNKALQDAGYKTFLIKTSLVDPYEDTTAISNVMATVMAVAVIVGVFFISYFIIKIIFKSRNVYYTTVRMLGASRKITKQLLYLELFVVQNIAYIMMVVTIYLVNIKVINVEFLTELTKVLKFSDYIILYILITILSFLITTKYAKELYKQTAISTYGEEV